MDMHDIAREFVKHAIAQKDFNKGRYYYAFIFSGTMTATTVYSATYNPNLFMCSPPLNTYTVDKFYKHVLTKDVLGQYMGGPRAESKTSITQEFAEGFRVPENHSGSGMYVEFRGDDLYLVDGDIIAEGLYVINNDENTPLSEDQKTHLINIINKNATPVVSDDA